MAPEKNDEEVATQGSSKFWIYTIIGIIVLLVIIGIVYYFMKKKPIPEPENEKAKGISTSNEIENLKNEVKKVNINQETLSNDLRTIRVMISEIKQRVSVGNNLVDPQ